MPLTLAVRKLTSARILAHSIGKRVLNRYLTPRIMFLSAIASVLVGVAYTDERPNDTEEPQ